MCCATLSRSGKKPCLVMCVPRSLGTWSSTITRPMPALNPVKTGAEMKSATKPRRINRAITSIDADQRGQRGGRRHELGRVAVRNHQRQCGAGEDRQRGRRADAEHARRAEQRVDDHRDEGGVETHRHGQSGHRGVRHRLGQHDRGRSEAGDDVEAPDAAGGDFRADEGPRSGRAGRRRVSAGARSRESGSIAILTYVDASRVPIAAMDEGLSDAVAVLYPDCLREHGPADRPRLPSVHRFDRSTLCGFHSFGVG